MDNELFNNFINTLLSFRAKEEMQDFLYGILTPKEREELPKRLEIVKRLKNGQKQHEIAQELGVGIATVTRGSKELQQNRFKYIT